MLIEWPLTRRLRPTRQARTWGHPPVDRTLSERRQNHQRRNRQKLPGMDPAWLRSLDHALAWRRGLRPAPGTVRNQLGPGSPWYRHCIVLLPCHWCRHRQPKWLQKLIIFWINSLINSSKSTSISSFPRFLKWHEFGTWESYPQQIKSTQKLKTQTFLNVSISKHFVALPPFAFPSKMSPFPLRIICSRGILYLPRGDGMNSHPSRDVQERHAKSIDSDIVPMVGRGNKPSISHSLAAPSGFCNALMLEDQRTSGWDLSRE